MNDIRIGIVGLGANTRDRHVPGLLACRNVRLEGVCNRRPESTQAAARKFDIPKTYDQWQDLVADDRIDAVVIGTWPYLHSAITIAALDAGKHVLCEARMARNLHEAQQMRDASNRSPDRVAQIVPSPFGLRADQTVKRLIEEGFLGELREIVVLGTNDSLANPESPLHWRQNADYSGLNMLALGILHETLIRWTPDPESVVAMTHCFTTKRRDEQSGEVIEVGTPDSVQVLSMLPSGARGIYQLSGVIHHGPGPQIHLYGSKGTLKYSFASDELHAGRSGDAALNEVEVPDHEVGGWRVEAEFIAAIRGEAAIQFTDFATGVRYMAFTEAVSESASTARPVVVQLNA